REAYVIFRMACALPARYSGRIAASCPRTDLPGYHSSSGSITRRSVMRYAYAAALLAACAVAASPAFAQNAYPSKPIRLVHGFTPGGISDVLARAIGAKLSENLGQQVVVEPRPGAGTTIASELIAQSPGDGYTLFLQDITTHAINASLY